MTHSIHRIIDCDCVAPYALHLRFDDEFETTVDLANMLEGEIYTNRPKLMDFIHVCPR